MARLIDAPTRIEAAGQPPKRIEEFVGRVSTATAAVSIARMVSPPGWREPGQAPEFDEYSLVLAGELRAELRDQTLVAGPGQALAVSAGEWVRYATPGPEGATYVAICLPAFSPDTVHRDPA